MDYIVLEIQTGKDDAVATIAETFADRGQAEFRYHTALAYAAVSELPLHAASLLQSDGRVLECRSYAHDAPEPGQPEEGGRLEGGADGGAGSEGEVGEQEAAE